MATLDKKTVVVGCFFAVGLLVAGVAGVAHWSRATQADSLAERQAHAVELRQQIEDAAGVSAAPMAEASTRWQLLGASASRNVSRNTALNDSA